MRNENGGLKVTARIGAALPGRMTLSIRLRLAAACKSDTYTVKVGPYTHLVYKNTGRHVVIGKDAKKPQTITKDAEGWKIADPVECAISQVEGRK